jgi:hypothetical protein
MLRRMLGHPVVVRVGRVRVWFAGAVVKDSVGHRRSRGRPDDMGRRFGREFAANMVNDRLTEPTYKSAWPTISARRDRAGAGGACSGEVDAGSLAALRASQRADKDMRRCQIQRSSAAARTSSA